jgi:hypothetical protein
MEINKIKTFITSMMLLALLIGCAKKSSDADPNLIESPDTQGSTPSNPYDVYINQSVSQLDPADDLPIEFRLVFIRPILPSTFTVADVSNVGSATGVAWTIINSGNNSIFYLTATSATTQGTIIPELATALISDTYGNTNNASTSIDNSVTYATQLSLVIEQNIGQADPTGDFPIEFTIGFNTDIDPATFDISDITQNGTATGVVWNLINSGNNINFTLQAISAVGQGTLIPSVAANQVQTFAPIENNLVSTSADNTVLYVPNFNVAIEQKIAQPDPTDIFPIEFDVVFSEAIDVSTFVIGDIIQSGTATGLTWNIIDSGDQTNFTLQVTAGGVSGTIIPSLVFDTVNTVALGKNNASSSIDNSVTLFFKVYTFINQKVAQLDPAAILPVEFDVVFSEAIDPTTFITADITQLGAATGVVWNIIDSGDQTNFTLQATAVTTSGTLIPNIAANLIQTVGLIDNYASVSFDNLVTLLDLFDVTVEQKIGQLDPAMITPVEFTVVFSEPIDPTTFILTDITQSGSATGITWNIIDSGDQTTFTLQATAITGEGTLTPSLAAGMVQTVSAKNNTVSTSIDNSVTYDSVVDVTIEQAIAQLDPTQILPIDFDVVFDEAIDPTTFVIGDIVQSGTATGITWTITDSGDQTIFTLSAIAVTGQGTLIPSLNASSINTIGLKPNAASTSTDNSVTYDFTFDVSIEQKIAQLDPTAVFNIEFDVVFDEAIDASSFIVGDIIQNGTATVVAWNIIDSGDQTNFTLQALSSASDGTIIPSIAASTLLTLSLKDNTVSTSSDNDVTYNALYDVTVEQKIGQLDPATVLPIEFTIVFEEAIDPTSFDITDITQNGTATGITWDLINSGDNITYTLQATAVTAAGTLIPSIAATTTTTTYGSANNASDSIDNDVTFDMNFTVTIEQKIGQADPTNSLPAEFTVTFGQAINPATFTVGDITQSGTATGITWDIIDSGDQTIFTLQAIAVVGTGTLIPSLAVDTVQDAGSYNNYASTSTDNSVDYALTFDVTINQKVGQNDPATSYPVEFTVVFSTAIDPTSFVIGDVTQLGTATVPVWNIVNSGDNITFTLQVTGTTTDGTLIPSLAAGVVADSGVMTNALSTATDGIITLETTIAITNIVEPVDGSYGQGAELNFQVIFAEAIDVTGNPRIVINVGGVTRYASYSQGTGTTGIEFKYTVADGENDVDGITLQSAAIDLFGGTLIGNVTAGIAKTLISGFMDPLTNVLINTTQLPPDQVMGVVTAPTTSNTEMGVSWTVPNGNGSPLVDYSVQYREQGNSTWINIASPVTNSTVVTGLVAGITYEIRVAANNGVLGPYSSIATAEIFDVMSLNPIAWLDATDINGDGTTPTNGSKVVTWVDLTGVAQDASEANTALQPVYTYNAQSGLPAVRFDDLNRGLSGSFTRTVGTDLTIIIVGQYDSGYTDKCMFEFIGGGSARAFFIDRRYAGNTFYSPALTKNSFQMWTITNAGTYSTVSEGSTTQLYAGNNNFNTDFTGVGTYYLGDDSSGGNRMYGFIGEILIFDQNLSPAEIAQIENYLQSKWGL